MEEEDGDNEWSIRSWLDATTKAMEEHDDEGHEEHDEDEGGGTAGEDWKMKKTTKVLVVRRRLCVIRLKLSLVFGLLFN